MHDQASSLPLAVALAAVLQLSLTASAQALPGQGYAESPNGRASYQAIVEKSGPNCPGLRESLYGTKSRCIARFSPGAKAPQDYSEASCTDIDLRMKACGVPIPKMSKGLTPAELREQDRARQIETRKP